MACGWVDILKETNNFLLLLQNYKNVFINTVTKKIQQLKAINILQSQGMCSIKKPVEDA